MDLYFRTSRTPVLIISSGIYLGNVIGALLGVELYLYGGWFLTALGMAFINLLPCVFLACLDIRSNTKEETPEDQCCFTLKLKELSVGQNTAYYAPDFAFLMVNVFFACLLYAAPYRELLYDNVSLDTTEYLMNIATVIAMAVGTLITLVTVFNTFLLMIICNIVFYTGCIVMYLSTTDEMTSILLPLGTLLGGIGEVVLTNSLIASKFTLYERWQIGTDHKVGEHATMVFNAVDAVGYMVGAVLSSYVLETEITIRVVVSALSTGIVTTAALVFVALKR